VRIRRAAAAAALVVIQPAPANRPTDHAADRLFSAAAAAAAVAAAIILQLFPSFATRLSGVLTNIILTEQRQFCTTNHKEKNSNGLESFHEFCADIQAKANQKTICSYRRDIRTYVFIHHFIYSVFDVISFDWT
jgi:hypothetical protein